MALLFSYGSNNPQQLSQRLGRPVSGTAAFAPGYGRIFRGYSKKWGGGVAGLELDSSRTTYGYVEEVTPADLKILDGYEGVAIGFYRRETIKVQIKQPDGSFRKANAIIYNNNKTVYSEPSKAYLEAIVKTISAFWSEGGRKIQISDIPLRNPDEYCQCD